jgi:glutamate N-acetyltransferase/amino-acid N-acetyltransferase
MATMLAFVATDAAIEQALLESCLQHAVERSFNRITVDGDTSSNDACVLMATGANKLPLIVACSEAYGAVEQGITRVCTELAQAIVRDGEGATKFISIEVDGGESEQECLQVAYSLAHSPLVKTAFFASDPNWGRLLAAVGRAGLRALEIGRVSIALGDLRVVHDGALAADYTEAAGQAVMARREIPVCIHLGRGDYSATVWTCDLSYDYVRINAEYRT